MPKQIKISSSTHVLLKSWLQENNLLEQNHEPIDFKRAVAWFKRHLGDVQIYTPMKGNHFIDKKSADRSFLEFNGTLEHTNENKRKAALKLDARNNGIRVAKRAGVLPNNATEEMRRLFWDSEKGQELYNYMLVLKYTQKPELAPPELKLEIPTISAEFAAVLKDNEKIDLACLSFESDKEGFKEKVKGPTNARAAKLSQLNTENAKKALTTPLKRGRPRKDSIVVEEAQIDLDLAQDQEEGQ